MGCSLHCSLLTDQQTRIRAGYQRWEKALSLLCSQTNFASVPGQSNNDRFGELQACGYLVVTSVVTNLGYEVIHDDFFSLGCFDYGFCLLRSPSWAC